MDILVTKGMAKGQGLSTCLLESSIWRIKVPQRILVVNIVSWLLLLNVENQVVPKDNNISILDLAGGKKRSILS